MLNILISYPYLSKSIYRVFDQNKDKIRFILDSGAFGFWKANKKITVEDYIASLKDMPFEPWRYFTLDVVGDPEASKINYYKVNQNMYG